MDKQILYYYGRGVASYLIAKKLGVSNTKVRSVLKRHSVALRGSDVVNKASAAKRTPEENKEITRKASAANLGATHTNLHRVRLAVSRQRNPKIDPVYELPLIRECEKQSEAVIPQKSFYKYNVDLYLSDKDVVVEIFGGGFHNKPQAVKLFRNKMNYLSSKAIPVVVVWADKLTFNPAAVLAVARSASVALTIIDGQGRPTTRGLDFILDNEPIRTVAVRVDVASHDTFKVKGHL